MTLTCHCLIGIPGSGKSTLAAQWLTHDPDLVIICPDTIRDHLYGDPIIQGDWDAVQAEVQRQFKTAIAQQRTMLYDATNVKRGWRTALTTAWPDLRWIGWQLMTPLKDCVARNAERDRQVPMDVLIDYAQTLHQEPPQLMEGFAAIHEVPMDEQHQVD